MSPALTGVFFATEPHGKPNKNCVWYAYSFPGAQMVDSDCNVGDMVSIPGSGRSPGEGNGKPLQYFCLENSMDRGAW